MAGIFGVAAAIARLKLASGVVENAVTGALPQIGAESVRIIQRHASGRPGPNVITNELRGGITFVITGGFPRWSLIVYSLTVYAPRVEFGWRGPDAIGRVIETAPFPFFQPSIPEIAPIVEKYIAGSVRSKLL